MLNRLGGYIAAAAADVYDRVVVHYKWTLAGIALAGVAQLIDYLLAHPIGSWMTYVQSALVFLGAVCRSKSTEMLARPPPVALAFLAALAFASPARADGPLVHCFSGCGQAKAARAGALTAMSDVQVSPTIWVGPSIGFNAMVRDSGTKTFDAGFRPSFGYGVGYRPASWTATKSLAKLDLFLSGEFTGSDPRVDTLPMVTLLDVVSVGFGPRFHFATPNGASAVSWLFAIGFATSLGTP